MATKRVQHNSNFMAAAAEDQAGALAYMLMAAFGVSLAELMDCAEQILANKDDAVVNMALTAGVQIRGNVVFVGNDFADMRYNYPTLIIEGDRPQEDTFNFSALHCLGHIFAHWSGHTLGQKIIKKAGSCITGQDTTKNQAGEINQEIAKSWAPEDLMKFQEILMKRVFASQLAGICDKVVMQAADFKNKLKPVIKAPVTKPPVTTKPPPAKSGAST